MAKKHPTPAGSPIPAADAADTAAARWDELNEAFVNSGMPEPAAALIMARLERYVEAKVVAMAASKAT
jgi:hypothetical protein